MQHFSVTGVVCACIVFTIWTICCIVWHSFLIFCFSAKIIFYDLLILILCVHLTKSRVMYSNKNSPMSYKYYDSILTNNHPWSLPLSAICPFVVYFFTCLILIICGSKLLAWGPPYPLWTVYVEWFIVKYWQGLIVMVLLTGSVLCQHCYYSGHHLQAHWIRSSSTMCPELCVLCFLWNMNTDRDRTHSTYRLERCTFKQLLHWWTGEILGNYIRGWDATW